MRGNEITITGPEDEAEQLARLFEELLALLEKGHELSDSSVGQTIELIKGGGDEERRGETAAMRPSEVLGDTLLTARGNVSRAEDGRAEAVRRRDAVARP